MKYQQLVDLFLADNIFSRNRNLCLINPYFDEKLRDSFIGRFADWQSRLDYLHDRERDFSVQFVGSHWWTSYGLYKTLERHGELTNPSEKDTCPFDSRVNRLGLKRKFQLSNCAMGYIPVARTASARFTPEQVKYLQQKKFAEYQAVGTHVVFALGQTALEFHLYGTDIRFKSMNEAISHGRLDLPNGLAVIPMPHPGALGILTYLRMKRRRQPLDSLAQDRAFVELIRRAAPELYNWPMPRATSDIVEDGIS